jgi:hypothetical protein
LSSPEQLILIDQLNNQQQLNARLDSITSERKESDRTLQKNKFITLPSLGKQK